MQMPIAIVLGILASFKSANQSPEYLRFSDLNHEDREVLEPTAFRRLRALRGRKPKVIGSIAYCHGRKQTLIAA